VALAAATGAAPPDAMCLEALDDRVRAAIDGDRDPGASLPSPLDTFERTLDRLDAPDEQSRGRAQAVLRSATRARAVRITELVAAARGDHAGDDGEVAVIDRAVAAAVARRLGDQVCEYGLRATLLGCLGDLVDAAAHGPAGGHGKIAARALRVVAASRWARDADVREHRRFRKPVEDLLDRCVAGHPRLRAAGDVPVPPALAAWWALCAGPTAPVVEIGRDPSIAGAVAAIDGALRGAADGAPPDAWGPAIDAALDQLGVRDTALAVVTARLVSVLAAARALSERPDDFAAARDLLVELSQVMTMYQEVASDVDAALAPAGAVAEPGVADLAGGPGAAWLLGRDRASGTMWSGPDTAPLLLRWEQALIPAWRDVVLPAARRLAELAGAAERHVRHPGLRIGGFELIELLGGGGMGDVWKARRGQQLVALKLPKQDAPAQARALLADVLRREAGRLEAMSFAKVATFIDAGVDGDLPYLATAYMRGRTLEEHVLAADAPRIGLPLMKRIVRDVCIGLANLHEVRIVHRDVKPHNVFLRLRGRDGDPLPRLADDPTGRRVDEAVLIDLGIAQVVGGDGVDAMSWGYVAPEVLDPGAMVGPPADVYALAASVFHVMTGVRFAEGRSPELAMIWHVGTAPFDDPAVRAAAATLPRDVVDLLAAATAVDPAQRPTVEELDSRFAEV
jgi:eukaryotic-like serine/threonine-protein kinase